MGTGAGMLFDRVLGGTIRGSWSSALKFDTPISYHRKEDNVGAETDPNHWFWRESHTYLALIDRKEPMETVLGDFHLTCGHECGVITGPVNAKIQRGFVI